MGKEHGVCAKMEKLDHVVMPNHASSAGIGNLLCRKDLPMVVRIVVRVACHLLAWI